MMKAKFEPKFKRQQGIALLTVMLIVSLMVVVATQFSQRLQLDIARTSNLQDFMQRQQLLLGAEQYVRKIVKQDITDSERIHLDQNWATRGMVFPLGDAQISGVINDQQACFNLNSLNQANKPDGSVPLTAQLFTQLQISAGLDSYNAEQVTDALRDWIDSDTIPLPLGAEDSSYEALSPPYLPANNLLSDISEFRAVYGVTSQIYNQLSHLVCVLPETRLQLNLNTIEQPELFEMLFYPNLSKLAAQQLIDNRPRDGYRDLENFFAEPAIAGLSRGQVSSLLGFSSNYFIAELVVSTEQGQNQMRSLIQGKEAKVIQRIWGGVAR